MEYKYFGYFISVLIIIMFSISGWVIVMFKKEKSILDKLTYLKKSTNNNWDK